MLNRMQALKWVYENLGSWPDMQMQKECNAPDGWYWNSNLLSSYLPIQSIWASDFNNYAHTIRSAKP